MKNKKKNDNKSIIFIISTIIIGILIFIASIILIALIVDLKNLTFPLTGISGILLVLLFILSLIFLEIALKQWKSNKNSKKKFITSLILFICVIFIFLIAPSINTYIRDNNIMYRNLGNEEYTIGGISYEVSKKWEHKEGTKGDYFYPYAGSTDGMLYVTASYSRDFIDADSDFAFDNFIEGMQESDDYEFFKISKRENIKILDYEGIKLTYNCTLDKKYYEMQVYAFLDSESGTLYSFANGSTEKIDTKIKKEVKKVINSIKDKQKPKKKIEKSNLDDKKSKRDTKSNITQKDFKCNETEDYEIEYNNVLDKLYPYGYKVYRITDYTLYREEETSCLYKTSIRITNMYGSNSEHTMYIGTNLDKQNKTETLKNIMIDNIYVYGE